MPWVSQSKLDELKALVEAQTKLLADLSTKAVLVKIERKERYNLFTFAIGKELYELRTMSLLSDNFDEWQSKLVH